MLEKEHQWYYLTYNWKDSGVQYIFSWSISPKVSVIAWLQFELAYFGTVVQHFSHYTWTIRE